MILISFLTFESPPKNFRFLSVWNHYITKFSKLQSFSKSLKQKNTQNCDCNFVYLACIIKNFPIKDIYLFYLSASASSDIALLSADFFFFSSFFFTKIIAPAAIKTTTIAIIIINVVFEPEPFAELSTTFVTSTT